jgi:hypothetical protein
MRIVAAALFCALAWTAPSWAREGQIVDAATGAAIAGATVTLDARVIETDASGHFEDDGTAAVIKARAPGYQAASIPSAEFWSGNARLKLTPIRPKALYLSMFGIANRALRDGALQLIRDAKLNALVIDVKGDRGLIAFHSANPLAAAVGAQRTITIPDLHALVQSLHQQGLYTIARIVTFKDNPLASQRPDLAIKLANGALFRDREGLTWSDPTQKQVRDYNISVAVEAARAGFDEIQFDYVRFPDAPSGKKFAKPTTQASRLDAVAAFLGEARQALQPYNVYLAVDIFGYVCWNTDDTGIGQRLDRIMPLVDYLSPMLYPSGFQYGIPGYRNPVAHPYEVVRLSLERARARTGVAPIRFRPWLQAFRDYAFDRRIFDANEVASQIRGATEFGSDGWMFWNPRNTYGSAGLAASQTPPAAGSSVCS